jgi:uncharacterized protein (DUF1330 family)
MRDYGGRIVSAFETTRNPDGSGEEIYYLEFQGEVAFNQYRLDPRYLALDKLRQKAISGTEIKIVAKAKTYE